MYFANVNYFDPNPWQPRQAMAEAALQELADNIRGLKEVRRATCGLLQLPSARLVGPDVPNFFRYITSFNYGDEMNLTAELERAGYRLQIGIGHRRHAAFLGLAASDADYLLLPFELVDFSDEEMFKIALSENVARADLSPIEVAQAMARYRDEFGKSSKEIGGLFGMSDSAVRNMMRLLELPAAVQQQVASGEISQGTARKLLTLQKLSPRMVENVAKTISSSGEITSDEVVRKIQEGLKKSKNAVLMWAKWRGKEETPRGGAHLFDYDWRPAAKKLPRNQFDKYVPKHKTEVYYEDISVYTVRDGMGVEEVLEALAWVPELSPEYVADVVLLTHPPACRGCQFYGVIEGDHYCGAKPCWEIKREAWLQEQAERISRETGIPIYDPKRDGAVFDKWDRWGSNAKRWPVWWEERAEHLRLYPHYTEYNYESETANTTGQPHVQVISVRQEYQQEVEREQQERAKQKAHEHLAREQSELGMKRRELAKAFVSEVAGVVFAEALQGVNVSVLEAIARQMHASYYQNMLPDEPKERHGYTRRFVATMLLGDMFSWKEFEEGTLKVAKHLEGVARAWGVKLPGAWSDQVQQFLLEGDREPDQGVSAETGDEDLQRLEEGAHHEDWLEN